MSKASRVARPVLDRPTDASSQLDDGETIILLLLLLLPVSLLCLKTGATTVLQQRRAHKTVSRQHSTPEQVSSRTPCGTEKLRNPEHCTKHIENILWEKKPGMAPRRILAPLHLENGTWTPRRRHFFNVALAQCLQQIICRVLILFRLDLTFSHFSCLRLTRGSFRATCSIRGKHGFPIPFSISCICFGEQNTKRCRGAMTVPHITSIEQHLRFLSWRPVRDHQVLTSLSSRINFKHTICTCMLCLPMSASCQIPGSVSFVLDFVSCEPFKDLEDHQSLPLPRSRQLLLRNPCNSDTINIRSS